MWPICVILNYIAFCECDFIRHFLLSHEKEVLNGYTKIKIIFPVHLCERLSSRSREEFANIFFAMTFARLNTTRNGDFTYH